MFLFYYEYTQGKLKLYRENTGNFAFWDEWEPWDSFYLELARFKYPNYLVFRDDQIYDKLY